MKVAKHLEYDAEKALGVLGQLTVYSRMEVDV